MKFSLFTREGVMVVDTLIAIGEVAGFCVSFIAAGFATGYLLCRRFI
jgi:hypothetical protein